MEILSVSFFEIDAHLFLFHLLDIQYAIEINAYGFLISGSLDEDRFLRGVFFIIFEVLFFHALSQLMVDGVVGSINVHDFAHDAIELPFGEWGVKEFKKSHFEIFFHCLCVFLVANSNYKWRFLYVKKDGRQFHIQEKQGYFMVVQVFNCLGFMPTNLGDIE
jgi:hypothetical protein